MHYKLHIKYIVISIVIKINATMFFCCYPKTIKINQSIVLTIPDLI